MVWMRLGTSMIVAPLLVLGLVACDGGGSGPAAATRQWLEATLNKDGNRAASLVCDEMQTGQMTGAALLAATEILGSQFLGGLDLGLDVDVSDLNYETVSQNSGRATVHVSGDMRVSVLGVSQAEPMDNQVELIQEDGQWKVCG